MKYVPPESGIRPIPTKPGTKNAASEASRMSHAHASERPAPAQTPFTAAMTGFSSARIARTLTWYVARSIAATSPRLAERRQVLPGREAAAGAGDDDRAHLGIARLLERRLQPLVHARA